VSDLVLSGITRSYGPTRVLHGIHLSVPSGSFTAILGPSGCGKTTLLRLIGGFDEPDSGTICLGDTSLYANGRSVPPERRRIGYVAQEGALFPHLSVADNVAFGLKLGKGERQARVAKLLATVGLTDADIARRFPHELSGGQQQRVALARALAPAPKVILLDEPFSSLDASLRETTRRLVAESLRAAGATTILVTHDQAEALSLADRVAVMRDGRLVQVASPRELYRRPVDVETALSIGDAVILSATVGDGYATCALGRLDIDVASTGATGQILIRPEQIVLVPPGTPASASAQVVDVSYFGHDALARLELDDLTVVTARTPGYAAPRPRDRVGLVVEGSVHSFDR
jgi:iron(III) transport system ATP-binding protein